MVKLIVITYNISLHSVLRKQIYINKVSRVAKVAVTCLGSGRAYK
jgi:hypothetical protein